MSLCHKVKESMRNLETVVRERNRAYHTLETGSDGERPGRIKQNIFGLEEFFRCTWDACRRFHS